MKLVTTLFARVRALWARIDKKLQAANDRQVALWGSSLQYKRRYTNPDTAKQYRGRM